MATGKGNNKEIGLNSYLKQNFDIDAMVLSGSLNDVSHGIDGKVALRMNTNGQHVYYDGQTELLDEANKSQTLTRTINAAGTDEQQKSQELTGKDQQIGGAQALNDYDPDNKSETETKSLSSVKSNGSNTDLRY